MKSRGSARKPRPPLKTWKVAYKLPNGMVVSTFVRAATDGDAKDQIDCAARQVVLVTEDK